MYEERRAEALTTAQVEADEAVCGSFPRKLAWEQLRRLRKRSYNGTVEDAEKSNSAHVAAAASTTWEHVPRLPQHVHNLVRSGKGCPVVRQQVSAGLIPGSPFGSHGHVGWRKQSHTEMREWLRFTGGRPEPTRKRQEPITDRPQEATGATQGADEPPQTLDTVDVEDYVESLRPATARGTDPPQWLIRLAGNMQRGDAFWA